MQELDSQLERNCPLAPMTKECFSNVYYVRSADFKQLVHMLRQKEMPSENPFAKRK